MVDAATLGQAIIWLTYLTIGLIAVLLSSKIVLYARSRRSRFGLALLLFVLMLAAFLIAEVLHLWDMTRAPAAAEVLYTLTALLGFLLFGTLIHALARFSQQVGFADREFTMALRLQQQLCPVCRKVEFKVPLRELIERGQITQEGGLAPGITLDGLVRLGLVTHKPHPKGRA